MSLGRFIQQITTQGEKLQLYFCVVPTLSIETIQASNQTNKVNLKMIAPIWLGSHILKWRALFFMLFAVLRLTSWCIIELLDTKISFLNEATIYFDQRRVWTQDRRLESSNRTTEPFRSSNLNLLLVRGCQRRAAWWRKARGTARWCWWRRPGRPTAWHACPGSWPRGGLRPAPQVSAYLLITESSPVPSKWQSWKTVVK